MAAQRPGRNSKAIFRKRTRLNVRKNFYSQRSGPVWNKLGNEVVESKKTGTFKKKYDRAQVGQRERMENDQFVWYR